ncbi:MAG: RsmB/NOP family class I SAM-dependent RNA methyltransferase [Bacteroidetes bacterium]|nr:MAG: RsmB/NOP family class I SAM-dependent RNA methyltransferase [Bacteroidota bacterium]REK35854.1 MAG: RsmB/NOP family class I SAM-dependent RNA methyltransferase [Bacteroidota bacterium]REK50669.1 MAG: RsmB/NOP family class I SAM-dependent RNA methyltransferase [Bacteroidota bacterium]
MKEFNQLRIALALIESYQGEVPLALYLRNEFRKTPAMGSRDRRLMRSLVNNYFRIGNFAFGLGIQERLLIANLICETEMKVNADVLEHFLPSLNPSILSLDIKGRKKKIEAFYGESFIDKLFPFPDLISGQLNKEAYILSLLVQPMLWIRIRKNHLEQVIHELKKSNIEFLQDEQSELCLGFSNSVPLNTLTSYKSGFFEIQDKSSQMSLRNLPFASGQKWWDACSGSGGKSLLLKDICENIELTVSDIRGSILVNLKERMKKAGHKKFNVMQFNAASDEVTDKKSYDGIIADVPCSGSGTWSRTPESLQFFNKKKLEDYFVPLQRKIAQNLTKGLKEGGTFAYITCSVFEAENEGNVEVIKEKSGLELISSTYMRGYSEKADTMFCAILKKSG